MAHRNPRYSRFVLSTLRRYSGQAHKLNLRFEYKTAKRIRALAKERGTSIQEQVERHFDKRLRASLQHIEHKYRVSEARAIRIRHYALRYDQHYRDAVRRIKELDRVARKPVPPPVPEKPKVPPPKVPPKPPPIEAPPEPGPGSWAPLAIHAGEGQITGTLWDYFLLSISEGNDFLFSISIPFLPYTWSGRMSRFDHVLVTSLLDDYFFVHADDTGRYWRSESMWDTEVYRDAEGDIEALKVTTNDTLLRLAISSIRSLY